MKTYFVLTAIITCLILSSCSPKSTVTSLLPPTAAITPRPTIITPSGIPDLHQISTAFIPQAPQKDWQQPWQDACEEAALLTVDYYYQKQSPSVPDLLSRYQQLFEYESSRDYTHDVNLEQMSSIASDFLGYQPQIINNPGLDDIKNYLVKDIPVIVPANGKTLFRENKHFKNGGPWYHNLVILGYDDQARQFIVHDVGTQFGAYFRYSYDLLLSAIHDFPPSGNKEDINNGLARILVLLK